MAHPLPHVSERFPIAQLDLAEEVRQLRSSPLPHGHVAKSVLHNSDLRVVLMVLDRGARIARHHAKGSVLLHTIDGRVSITLLDTTFELGPGSVFAIEPEVAHAVFALEDAAMMLTITHCDHAAHEGAVRHTGYRR